MVICSFVPCLPSASEPSPSASCFLDCVLCTVNYCFLILCSIAAIVFDSSQLMLQVLASQTARLTFKASRVNAYLLARPYAKPTTGTLPLPPPLSSLTNSDESNEARRWIAKFKSESITRGSVELSFSRSSGPGGQVCSSQFALHVRGTEWS